MTKYIVKNCPAYGVTTPTSCALTSDDSCEFTDCPIKQLARKTQIVEQQQKTIDELIGCVSLWERFTEEESKLAKDSSIADLIMLLRKKTQECEQIKEKYEALKLENQEGYEIVAELKHEYEGLKKQLETAEEWRIKAESLNEKLELKNTCCRKALEGIEEVYKTAMESVTTYDEQADLNITIGALHNISDLINKAKGGEDERNGTI